MTARRLPICASVLAADIAEDMGIQSSEINSGETMNKQQLASKIWESANKMRSKIEANEYKDYILGFIFYKYLSDTEVKYVRALLIDSFTYSTDAK
jgi:hypothetical protein